MCLKMAKENYWKTQEYEFIDTNNDVWSLLDETSELFIDREMILRIQHFNQNIKCNIVSSCSNEITVKINKQGSKKIASWLTRIRRSERPSQLRYHVSAINSRITFINVKKDFSNGMILYTCNDDDYDDDDNLNLCKGMIN